VVVALLALTALALWRRPMVGFLGAWIFITLAPTSSIVPIATEVGAERRMYLALAAIVALVVVGVWSSRGVRLQPDNVIDGVRLQPDNGPPKGGRHRWSRVERHRWSRVGRHRWSHAILLAAVCAALATATAIRNREYESSLTLSQTVLQRWPTAYAHAMVGIELAKIGRHDEAMAQLREATSGLPKARYHLGGELFNRGEGDQAIGELQRYVAEEPYALEAVRARLMIGQVQLRQRKYSPAIDQFRLVLSMTPASDDAHILAFGLMADALFGQEQLEEAARYYRAYLSAKPDDVAARGNLAKALFNKGDVDGAAAEARAILRTSDDAAAHDLLGRALGSQGKLEEARIEFERALKIDPNFQQAREDLAVIKKAKG
jgi:Flp pilus assembly protein TadD